MYVYQVHEGSYDLYYEQLLTHNLKFTQEEFESMCLEIVSKPENVGVVELVEKLIEDYGFKEYEHEYQADYYIRG
ncbi:hypothetical protein [Brevibacillus brevis]|uniref:hypothetical protein n=1 Tax=Brevibacillus brevis TaxID=1393 RepID=UPI0007D8A12A|nr:hypothetical protein [Brevibacillus brevis]